MENNKEKTLNKNTALLDVRINTQKIREHQEEIKLEIQFSKQINKCPICGSKTYYIRILDRYYCFNCKDYLP